jgi:rfaE bifunctional protein kinase chain/domain
VKEDLLNIVSHFEGKKVLVLGDVMLDEYIVGQVTRISPEAPVPVVAQRKVYYSSGGAANVAMNISSLGGKAYLVGLVGDDREGEQLKHTFVNNGINIEGLMVDSQRPTTLKTRIIAHAQQVVRVDREIVDPISEVVQQRLLSYAVSVLGDIDVVLISDYAKGMTVPALLRELIRHTKAQNKRIVVDPKGRDYTKYRYASVVAPNKREASQAVNGDVTDEDSLLYAGRNLLQNLECEAILITRGDEGMSLFQTNGDVTHLPAVAREVYDVTGAGDTVVATLSLALATGADWVDCAKLANEAAGIVVGKVGTATVDVQELQRAIYE